MKKYLDCIVAIYLILVSVVKANVVSLEMAVKFEIKERGIKMNVFAGAVDYFVKGGPCMWPLLMCSVGAVAVGVERYLCYKKEISGTEFMHEFAHYMNAFKLKEAKEYAAASKGEAAAMAVEILDINEDLGTRLESIVYAKADRIIDSFEKNINYLGVIIGLAPMLGLLGTITGMISSFNALNERAQNPMAVTAGIGEALITTVFGLCIAILGMCIHAWLTNIIKTETLNIYEVSSILSDIIQAKHENHKQH